MTIRIRQPSDIARCVDVLAAVHAADGYPLHWPADPPAWLTPMNLLSAWVAEDERDVLGHVALCGAVGDAAAPLWSAASHVPPERLAVVAKLFVALPARGRGVGATLLAQACAEAEGQGLRPALEVLGHDQRAIALYEATGWRRVASVAAPWARTRDEHGGDQAMLYYYLAPD
jgi:GNAT superfamily N-acetyltransferase